MEQRIHPTTTYIARCPLHGCRWTCSHDTLKAAETCHTDHDHTHHSTR